MYTKHFGLNILPFENVPDPKFFFDHGDHARVLKGITESLKAGRGLLVATGPIGSGKTTLSQKIISDFSNDIKLIWIAFPPGNSADLFLFIAQELGLKTSTSEMVFVIRDIRDALLKINSENNKCLLIIDESHLMSDDVINGIRLLNNLEQGSTKLIQILLLGQEELMKIIQKPEMEPFKQRIATLEIIGKMNADRIRRYISHRIEVAGGSPSIYTDTGWEAIAAAFGSEGTPRIINSLCDKSLTVAFERGKAIADDDDVYEASEGVGLQKEVFHYQLDLQKMKRKHQVRSSGENASIKEPETVGKGTIPSFSQESDRTDITHNNRQSDETSQSTRTVSEIGSFISKINHKSLKLPMLFLFLSIVTLFSSIFSYCQRAGSPELMTCLKGLINFFK